VNFVNVILINIQLNDIFLCKISFSTEICLINIQQIFSCETQYKRKHMQYAGAPTTTTANNTRTAGGSIGRQGRVSVTKIFENDFI
jgi:hypothetical protein